MSLQPGSARQKSTRSPKVAQPAWRKQLGGLRKAIQELSSETAAPPPVDRRKARRFVFGINLRETAQKGRLTVAILFQEQLKNGNWGKLKTVRGSKNETLQMADDVDRPLLELLFGNESASSYYYSNYSPIDKCILNPTLYEVVLPR